MINIKLSKFSYGTLIFKHINTYNITNSDVRI